MRTVIKYMYLFDKLSDICKDIKNMSNKRFNSLVDLGNVYWNAADEKEKNEIMILLDKYDHPRKKYNER